MDPSKPKKPANMFGWTKKIKDAPSMLAPKGTLSGAAASIKEQVTGHKVDVPDTSSPIMESKCKDLDQSAAFMEAILKSLRKQHKALRGYLESYDEVTNALTAYARSSFVADDLSQLLENSAKYESFQKSLLTDLLTQSMKVSEQMSEWVINGIPPASAEKKKFEAQRRLLDAANLKAARAERDNLPPAKLKEVVQEKEVKETLYLQAGEKAYAKIIDTIDSTKINNILQIHDHFMVYNTFFKQGWEHSQKEAAKFEEAKSKALTEQAQMKVGSVNRQKGIWAPSAIGGDTKRVFAMNYQQVIERDKPEGGILPFLVKCFKYLETRALTTTGLFRVSAPKPLLDSLRDKIDKGVEIDIDAIEEVHVVSGLIKLFLRELPAPLLTFELYKQWMSVIEETTPQTKVQKLKDVIAQLPECNRVLLKQLMQLCTKILVHKEENKMTVENLAIVLCPSILYDNSPDPLTMVQDIQKANTVMVLIVLNYNELFENGPPTATTTTSTSTTTTTTATTPAGPPPPSTLPPSFPKGAPATRPPAVPPPAGPPPPKGAPPPLTTSTSATTTTTASNNSSNTSNTENAQTTENGRQIEQRNGKYVTITPEHPAIPLPKLLPMIAEVDSTISFYKQLYELFDGSYMFTRAAYGLKDFSAEEINLLNNAFQMVGKAIKNMLVFIKDYTVVFPGEVGKRILAAANRVRPHVKSLIAYIKSFAGGQKLPVDSLIEATREFLVGTYQMFLVCYTASQADELSVSGFAVKNLVVQLSSILTTNPTQSNVSVAVNNLQNHTLKYTSLLRSRLPDIVEEKTQQVLSGIIESTEQTIEEVFDEARNMLVNNQLEMTPVFREKTTQLSTFVTDGLQYRPALDQSIAETSVALMVESTWEQLEAITTQHQEDDNPRVIEFVKYLSELTLAVRALGTQFKNCTEHQAEWLATCERVVTQFDHILQLIDQVLSSVDDESLTETMKTYVETTNHFLVQFKICGAATTFGIIVSGYESSSFIVPIKDFAFVTYPFMYNFRDACTPNDE